MLSPLKPVLQALGLCLAILLAACAPQAAPPATPTPTLPGTLTPFLTPTASSTPTPPNPATPTPLPSPTPTMRSHSIQRGEDLGGIAFAYRVSLPALMEANPGVDPYLLVVGSTLNIPPSAEAAEETPAPTPVAVSIGPVNCMKAGDGGAWCFVLITNNQPMAVESISAMVRMADAHAEQVVSQVAVAPLDLLLAGQSMPLTAYFPPRLPQEPFQASAELLTALPLPEDSGRYLPVQIENQAVDITPGGLEALVSGELNLGIAEGEASQVWVAAVAYNAEGQVIGLRRWENENPLPAGTGRPFQMRVYSAGGEISRVELMAEARP